MMYRQAPANPNKSKSLFRDNKNKLSLPHPGLKQQIAKAVTTRAQARRRVSPISSTKGSTLTVFPSPRKSTSQTLQSTVNPFSKSEEETIAEDGQNSQLFSNPEKVRGQPLDEYKAQIKEYLLQREFRCKIDGSYLSHGHMITAKMRVYLVRHLYKIYNRFELLRTTLHVAVHYMDVYFSKMILVKDQLQAIAISQACLFMAMKYVEIYPPDLCDWVDSRHKKDVLKLQAKILNALQFALNYETVQHFTQTLIHQKFQNSEKNEDKLDNMNLLADLTLFDMKIRQIPCSQLSHAIYSLVKKQTPPDNNVALSVKWMVERNEESLLWLKQQKYYSVQHSLI